MLDKDSLWPPKGGKSIGMMMENGEHEHEVGSMGEELLSMKDLKSVEVQT